MNGDENLTQARVQDIYLQSDGSMNGSKQMGLAALLTRNVLLDMPEPGRTNQQQSRAVPPVVVFAGTQDDREIEAPEFEQQRAYARFHGPASIRLGLKCKAADPLQAASTTIATAGTP